ncbi:hypothetical protein [Saccharopolyspora spinosa]|uniref:hypothetical protein n=1 Tax=Saccharopolyspora spinosa TaxID=60894 RepID=UPI003BABA07B
MLDKAIADAVKRHPYAPLLAELPSIGTINLGQIIGEIGPMSNAPVAARNSPPRPAPSRSPKSPANTTPLPSGTRSTAAPAKL